MLVGVRHGSTALNKGKEKIRSWKDVPLSKDGMLEAIATGKELKKLRIPVEDYHTSPLMRATQTANEIGDELNVDFTKTDRLKDWNVGSFTGQPVKDCIDEINTFIDNMSSTPPNGEPYQAFMDRCMPFLRKLIEDEKGHLVVTHNRVVTLLKAMADSSNGKPTKSILKKKGPIEPGGIIMIEPDWTLTVIHNHGDSKA